MGQPTMAGLCLMFLFGLVVGTLGVQCKECDCKELPNKIRIDTAQSPALTCGAFLFQHKHLTL